MAFFASAIDTLKILVIALGAGLGAWGVVNLLEGYGNDNPGAKSQGIKQLMQPLWMFFRIALRYRMLPEQSPRHRTTDEAISGRRFPGVLL